MARPAGEDPTTRRKRAKQEHPYGRRANADSRSRQARGDLRRQQILDAAIELFASRGFRGTGVAALAERVGMTAPGLLYYFGSKERLLQEVLAERDQADRVGPGDFLTLSSLRDLGRHNVETATLTRLYVVLGAESIDVGEPLHDFFADRYHSARHFARAVLEAEQQQGRVRRDVDVEQMATEMIATLMGLEIQWLTDPARVDLASSTEAYIDRLVEQLAP